MKKLAQFATRNQTLFIEAIFTFLFIALIFGVIAVGQTLINTNP